MFFLAFFQASLKDLKVARHKQLAQNQHSSLNCLIVSDKEKSLIILTQVACTNKIMTMEWHALKNVNNCLNSNIYSYIETSGGQSSNLNLNVVHFFNTSVNLTSVAA